MKQALFLILLITWLPLFGQPKNFSGLIVYEYQFENPVSGEDVTEQMAQFFGSEQHYYINTSNYKSYDEDGNLGQLYNSKNNTYYFVNSTNGQVMKRDAADNISEILAIHHLEETETILGRICKKLVVQTESSETTYWYNPQIIVPSRVYENHKFGGWANYMKASKGALPLKYMVKTQNYILTSTAKSIEEIKLTEDDFILEDIMSEN